MVSEVICRFESWESFERQSGVAAAQQCSAILSHLTGVEKAKLEGRIMTTHHPLNLSDTSHAPGHGRWREGSALERRGLGCPLGSL